MEYSLYHLIEAVSGAMNPNGEGTVTIDSIHEYIKSKMNQKDSQKISQRAQNPQDGLSIVLGSYGQSDKKIKEIIDEVKSLIKLNDFAYCLKAVKKLWQLQAPDVESCKKPQQEYDYHMLKRELHDSLDKYGSVFGWLVC